MLRDQLWETKDCSRCGGCGQYSFNTMDGSRCYGCGGTGRQLTKQGAAAREAWTALAFPAVTVDEVRPGMRLRLSGLSKRWLVCEVESVEEDNLNPGRHVIRFVEGSALGAYAVFPDTPLMLSSTQEEKARAYELVAHMKGALLDRWPEAVAA